MRIVVTGAGGFVGRALVALLAAHDVVAVDATLGGLAGIEGDIRDRETIDRVFAGGCDALVHLATIPGGAAETDPAAAQSVNIDATMALFAAAAAAGHHPRIVFASSIAVFGDDLPAQVDDATPVAPSMLYGGHKAMMETWLGTLTRRGAVSGLALRLPGIVARPRAPSGMKSAFMSDVFHAFAAREAITLPVSPAATMWMMSVARVAANIAHALAIPDTGSLTLPALRVTMEDLVAALARTTGASPELVDYAPDPTLETGFGRQPLLLTPRSDGLGFAHDGDIDSLIASALAPLSGRIGS